MFRRTRLMADYQFENLTDDDKKIYRMLESSNPIYYFIHHGCYDDHNDIINFQIDRESKRVYFKFNIADSLSFELNSTILYNVSGSIIEVNNLKNVVYTVQLAENNQIVGVYVDKNTMVKEKIILHEISKISNKFRDNEVISVVLTIEKYPDKDEVFLVDKRSQVYKLYNKKLIDLTTFCNLILFQAHDNKDTKVVENNRACLAKKLSRKFITKNRKEG